MSEAKTTNETSWRAFVTVWAGQLVSLTGTTVTGFGLQLYVFAQTRSVTDLAVVALAFSVPAIVLSPLAGSVADRYDRRIVMLGADLVSGGAVVVMLVLHLGPGLDLWHIVLGSSLGAGANAFQNPAWAASVPVLVPRSRLERANGLVQLNEGAAYVAAPAIAGALLAGFGLGAVLIVDLVSFLFAVATLLGVRFPPYERIVSERRSVWADIRFAWRYLRERPGLLAMLLQYPGVNFMLTLTNVLLIPLIISFSTEASAGIVLSIAGAGAVLSSLAVSVRGLPSRLMMTIMGGIALMGVAQIVSGVRPSLWVVGLGSVLLFMLGPVVNAASHTIWQTKVAEGAQGRVFSFRRMLGHIASPLAILVIGPAADRLFEPLLAVDGRLADSVGSVIGTGPGRGIGFIFVLAGLATIGLAALGWSIAHVRHLETDIPDAAGRPG